MNPSLFLILASLAGAIPPPVDSSLAGAPGGHFGPPTYQEWMQMQQNASGGAMPPADQQALSAGTDCSQPGATSCALVSSGKPSGPVMLGENEYVENIGGKQYFCTGPGAGMAGPPFCQPCDQACMDKKSAEKKAEQAKKEAAEVAKKEAADAKKKELADADRRAGFRGENNELAANSTSEKSAPAPGARTPAGGQPQQGGGEDLIRAFGGGGVGSVLSNGGSDLTAGATGGGANGGGAASVNGSEAPLNPTLTTGSGQSETISSIADHVTNSLVNVYTQLQNGSRTGYGAASRTAVGAPGSSGSTGGGIEGPFKSGSCAGTYDSLCKNDAKVNSVIIGALQEFNSDGKRDGAVTPGRLGGDNKSFNGTFQKK